MGRGSVTGIILDARALEGITRAMAGISGH